MVDYIYALTYQENGKRVIFYIGRTINPKTRLAQHKHLAANYQAGYEWKYEYAHTLDLAKIPWTMEILLECDETCEFYEDYYINLHRDQPLQNMRKGDIEVWMGRDYASVQDFLSARTKAISDAKIREEKVKEEKVLTGNDVDRSIFVGEDPNKKFMSEGTRKLLEKFKQGKK